MKQTLLLPLVFLFLYNLSFSQCPTVDAGTDQIYCKDGKSITLSATVVDEIAVAWTTSGTGVIVNTNINNLTYNPSVTDYANGSVTLTITATGNGSCQPVSDAVIITFNDVPTVDVGNDRLQCDRSNYPAIYASLTGATSGIWSNSGTGSATAPTSQGTYYYFSPADVAAGSVVLTFTTTNNGNCNAQSDDFTMTIYPEPIVDLGPDLTVCGNSTNGVNLSANITNGVSSSHSISWSTQGDGNISNANTFNATYTPTVADVNSGSVSITAIVVKSPGGNGSCVVTETINIYFNPAVVADAGEDNYILPSVTQVYADGSASSNATSYTWTSTGTGSFSPDNTTASAIYILSAADIAAGTVTLTLSVSNGSCTSTDTKLVAFDNSTSIIPSSGNSLEIKAYPNPVSDVINFELQNAGECTVSVFNTNGIKVIEEKIIDTTNNISISTESLPSGFYLIKVEDGEKLYKAKIYKQ